MLEKLISERIDPVADTFDTENTPVGEPPFPARFIWRKKEYAVDQILRKWKETGADRSHGSGEKYLRKHWFHIRTTSGKEMKIYFERQARSKTQRKTRWWLYTLVAPSDP